FFLSPGVLKTLVDPEVQLAFRQLVCQFCPAFLADDLVIHPSFFLDEGLQRLESGLFLAGFFRGENAAGADTELAALGLLSDHHGVRSQDHQPQSESQQHKSSAKDRARNLVQPNDCLPSQTLPFPSFAALLVFARGDGSGETIQNVPQTARPTPVRHPLTLTRNVREVSAKPR